MRTKYIATVKINIKGMHPSEIPSHIDKIKSSINMEEIYEFFGGKDNLLLMFVPVKEGEADFKVERLEIGNKFAEDLFLPEGINLNKGPRHLFVKEPELVGTNSHFSSTTVGGYNLAIANCPNAQDLTVPTSSLNVFEGISGGN